MARSCYRSFESEALKTHIQSEKLKLISAKLDEENVRAGERLAASDDTVAPFDNNTNEKLQSKHPLEPQIIPNKSSKIA